MKIKNLFFHFQFRFDVRFWFFKSKWKMKNDIWSKLTKLSEYWPSMKCDIYSFQLHEKRVDNWERVA